MNIPKELIEQWWNESPTIYKAEYIAQRAAEWAFQQPVSMEPVQREHIRYMPAGTKLYTAAQLAQARQQAEQAKDVYFAERNQARDLVYEKNKRIAELESLLQQTLEAVGLFQRGEPCEESFISLATAIETAEVKP